MTTLVRSKRITRDSYLSGDRAMVSGPVYVDESKVIPVDTGPSREEIDLEIALRVEAAHSAVLEEGYRKGVAEGRRSVEGDVALLKGYIEQLDEEIGTVWAKIERHAANLSMEIAKKVVGEAAESHKELALHLAKRGVLLAREHTRVSLLANPEDVELLQNSISDILKSSEGVRQIEVIERSSIAKGGIIVECEVGQYDLRPEIQLEEIEKRLEISPDELEESV